jgi:hypothetical protein
MTTGSPGRAVTLVLVDRDGAVLGQLPRFGVDTPWWQDLEPVLAARPDVVILRLLSAERAPGHVMGGRVRYLAEVVDRPSGLQPYDGPPGELDDHPLRMPWARPGGPAADLAWAADQVTVVGEPVQVRSWNLSSIWRLPTADGDIWLKCVPPFFAHEAAVLQALAPSPSVPEVLAADGPRLLLAPMPGVDGYDATDEQFRAIVDALVGLQQATIGAVDGFLAAGVPDWRRDPFREALAAVVARRGARWSALARLLEGWDERWDAVDACGLPDVLFHGDAHPGNARIGVDPPVIFDWGDSGIGHPLLDLAVLSGERAALASHWLDAWASAVPGADPTGAWPLVRPLAVARGAIVFQRFLDGIEPSERPYHERDVEPFLDRADALLAADGGSGRADLR